MAVGVYPIVPVSTNFAAKMPELREIFYKRDFTRGKIPNLPVDVRMGRVPNATGSRELIFGAGGGAAMAKEIDFIEYKQLLRDIRTGEFLATSGIWTVDEEEAVNWVSASRILELCHEHPDRKLELVLKTPGEPDLAVALTLRSERM